jgi:hypothetical protein
MPGSDLGGVHSFTAFFEDALTTAGLAELAVVALLRSGPGRIGLVSSFPGHQKRGTASPARKASFILRVAPTGLLVFPGRTRLLPFALCKKKEKSESSFAWTYAQVGANS